MQSILGGPFYVYTLLGAGENNILIIMREKICNYNPNCIIDKATASSFILNASCQYTSLISECVGVVVGYTTEHRSLEHCC